MKEQLTVLIRANFHRTLSEAERLIDTGKVRVNGKRVRDTEYAIEPSYDTELTLRIGSRDYKRPAVLLEGDSEAA